MAWAGSYQPLLGAEEGSEEGTLHSGISSVPPPPHPPPRLSLQLREEAVEEEREEEEEETSPKVGETPI